MGLGVRLSGAFSDARERVELIREWIEQQCKEPLLNANCRNDTAGCHLSVCLHPAAESIDFHCSDDLLTVSANTSAVGPGYHVYLCDLLHEMGDELNIEWLEPAEGEGDDTGYFHSADPQDAYDQMLAWLRMLMKGVLDSARSGETHFQLALSLDCNYKFDDFLLTQLGPRDALWANIVAQGDVSAAQDFFAWWNIDQDSTHYLRRALCHMWTDVRWRSPITEEESLCLHRVEQLLEKAYGLAPTFSYPWREWSDVMRFLGQTGPLSDMVTTKAKTIPNNTPLLGYRRRPIMRQLAGGWCLKIPGQFAEEWDSDGTWHAWDSTRGIWLTAYKHINAQPKPEEVLAHFDEKGLEAFEYRSGELLGRAVLKRNREAAGAYWILSAESAVCGKRARCTIWFDQLSQKDWALDLWHSLSHSARVERFFQEQDEQRVGESEP